LGEKITLFLKGCYKPVNKKQLWIILIIGAVLLLASPTAVSKKEPQTVKTESDGQEYLSRLEKRLEETLEQVEGAGNITVLLTPKSFGKISIAKNTKSNVSTENQGYEEAVVLSSGDTPVILEEYYPTVGGALIVAEGAKTEQIKTDLKRAASAALQIGINRIEVLEGSRKH